MTSPEYGIHWVANGNITAQPSLSVALATIEAWKRHGSATVLVVREHPDGVWNACAPEKALARQAALQKPSAAMTAIHTVTYTVEQVRRFRATVHDVCREPAVTAEERAEFRSFIALLPRTEGLPPTTEVRLAWTSQQILALAGLIRRVGGWDGSAYRISRNGFFELHAFTDPMPDPTEIEPIREAARLRGFPIDEYR